MKNELLILKSFGSLYSNNENLFLVMTLQRYISINWRFFLVLILFENLIQSKELIFLDMSSALFFHAWEYINNQISQQQLTEEDKRVLTETLDGLDDATVIDRADQLQKFASLGQRVSYDVLHILLV